MQCKSLWIKASAKCINVNVKREHNTGYASPANQRQTMEFKSRSDKSDSVLLCCLGPRKLITLESGLFPVPNVAAVKLPWASVIVHKMRIRLKRFRISIIPPQQALMYN